MRACGALLALAACNQVYSLDGTKLVDAPSLIDAPLDNDDEDGDGVPNFMDNCPGIPNSDKANLDGDEVGDACDRTMNGGDDKIIAQFMFNQPAFDPQSWIGAGWEFRDGYIEQVDPNPEHVGAAMFTKLRPEGNTITVETRMIITKYESADARSRTDVVIDGVGGSTCALAASAMIAFTSGGPGTPTAPPVEMVPFTLRAIYARTAMPTTMNCRIGAINSASGGEMIPIEAIGIGSRGTTVKVEYVVIYGGDF